MWYTWNNTFNFVLLIYESFKFFYYESRLCQHDETGKS